LPGNLGDLQTGIYAMAYRLLDASNMIAYLFAVLLLPIFARMIKLGESVQGILRLAFTLLFTISVVASTASFFYSFEIMDLLYDHHVTEASFVFRLLMIDFVAVSATYVFGTLLTANGSLKIMNILASAGMLINIALNLYFIPRFMAQGAAVASLATQFVIALAQVLIVVKSFHFIPDLRYLIKLLGFVSGVILISYLSRFLPFDWKVSFVALLIVSALLAFLSGLLNIRSLLRQFGQPVP